MNKNDQKESKINKSEAADSIDGNHIAPNVVFGIVLPVWRGNVYAEE